MSDLKEIVSENFARYAGNVILDRAICDVRDMLKPSARMLMYSQVHITKNLPNKPVVKSARIVGDCLGHYYTHGDMSCYHTYMRMAKPFAMRYPLEFCQGNMGTITCTDDEAAPRYTEMRLSDLGYQLFKDLDKDTVAEWADNFDETDTYPKILCSKGFYNIVNGSTGIGVSLSASIPQFNIKDINNAMIMLIDDPNAEFDILPDFATGAILTNPNEVRESLKKGTGAACRLRSVVEYLSKERAFKVTEIPYGVYTGTISEEIKKLVDENPECGIEGINDGSGKTPDYMIYLKKTANPDKVLRLLYKETSLQSFFTINMTMLTDNGRTPKTLGLREALLAHIDHEKEVYRRGFLFDLKKIENRIHIIDGLLICLAHIDEVTQTIKASNSTAAASIALQQKFILDEEQAKAVLDMKLGRLAHLEVQKLEQEREELTNEANKIHTILDSAELFNEQLKNGWREVAKKYGDERRTKIMQLQTADNDEPIEVKQLQIMVTNRNNVVATETSTLYVARRGGVGSKLKLEQGEYVIDALTTSNTDTLMFFTNKGDVYHCNANMITLDTKMSLEMIMPIKNDTICAVANRSKQNVKDYAIFVTKNGYIKKSYLSEYESNRNMGIRAITLNEGDSIVSVIIANNDRLGILTELGNFLLVSTEDVRITGRATLGVHGIKLNDGDAVIAARPVSQATKMIASISGNGLFKKTSVKEFAVQGKNTKGSKLQKIGENDWMADFLPITEDCEVSIVATRSSIRLKTTDIPELSKGAMGNKSIKLNAIDNVIKFAQF